MKNITIHYECLITEKGKEDGSNQTNLLELKENYNEHEYEKYCMGYAEGLVFFDMHNQTKSIPLVEKLPSKAQEKYNQLYSIMYSNPELWK